MVEKTISPEQIAQVRELMEEKAGWDLPYVWIGEPDYDEDDNLIGTKLDYLHLEEHGFGHLLRSDLRSTLRQETIEVLAAREGLVPVLKMLPMEGITPQEALLINSVERPENRQPVGYYSKVEGEPSGSSKSVEEGTVIVIKYQPDQFFPLESRDLYRFVPVDRLAPEHLPAIENSLMCVEPTEAYSIEDPDEVRLVAETLEDLRRL
jgi:hypothetical protein